jgi:uncharacterized membrane protein (UPF0127 family)
MYHINKSSKTIYKTIFLIGSIVFLIVAIGVISNDRTEINTPFGSIRVEIADTDSERKTGLMNRQELTRSTGMLFKFDGPHDAGCFWMKDTFVPLDMVWLDASKKVIYVHENATPLSETSICPPSNGAYVVEVNAGEAKSLGMVVGAQLKF